MDKITDIPPFYHQTIVLKWIFFCIESVFKRTFGEIFGKKPPPPGGIPVGGGWTYQPFSWYRNMTIWPRVQGEAGAKTLALTPWVTPF